MPESNGAKMYVAAGEVARLFKVDPKTVARWSKYGILQTNGTRLTLRHELTFGGHRRYDWDEMQALHARLNAPEGR